MGQISTADLMDDINQTNEAIAKNQSQVKTTLTLHNEMEKLFSTTNPSSKALQRYYSDITRTALKLARIVIEDENAPKPKKAKAFRKKKSLKERLNETTLKSMTGFDVDEYRNTFKRQLKNQVYLAQFANTEGKFRMQEIADFATNIAGLKKINFKTNEGLKELTKWMRGPSTPDKDKVLDTIALATQLANAIDKYNRAVSKINNSIIESLLDPKNHTLPQFLKRKYDPQINNNVSPEDDDYFKNLAKYMPTNIESIEEFKKYYDLVSYELLLASSKRTLTDKDQIEYVLAGKGLGVKSTTNILNDFMAKEGQFAPKNKEEEEIDRFNAKKKYDINNFNELYSDLNYLRIIYHSMGMAEWDEDLISSVEYLIKQGEGALVAQVFKENQDLEVIFNYGEALSTKDQTDAQKIFIEKLKKKLENREKEYTRQEEYWSQTVEQINKQREKEREEKNKKLNQNKKTRKINEKTRQESLKETLERKKKFEKFLYNNNLDEIQLNNSTSTKISKYLEEHNPFVGGK